MTRAELIESNQKLISMCAQLQQENRELKSLMNSMTTTAKEILKKNFEVAGSATSAPALIPCATTQANSLICSDA